MDSRPAYTLTFAAGVSPAAAITAFAADPGNMQLLTWQQAIEHEFDGGVRAGEIPGWTFCYEFVGRRANQPVLARLSANTEALKIFYAEAKCFVTIYHNGHRVSEFDPGITPPGADDEQSWNERVIELMSTRRLDRHDAALEMITEHVGNRISSDMLHGPLLTAFLPPRPIPDPNPPARRRSPDDPPRPGLGRSLGKLYPKPEKRGGDHVRDDREA
jgi:hypothetical protein